MAIKSFIKKPFSIPKTPSMIPDSVQKESLFNGFKANAGWNSAVKQMQSKVVIKKGNRLDIILD